MLFQVFAAQSCKGEERKGEVHYWLNVNYIQCLKSNLPCECEETIKAYYSIALDTISHSKKYGITLSTFVQMEPNTYPIRKIGLKEYEVLTNRQDDNSWANLKLKNDTLNFYDGKNSSKFVELVRHNEFNSQYINKLNAKLLNEAFVERGYAKLEEIVNHDSLSCECNKWKENVNMLYVKGQPKGWTIEIANDSLQINEITNMDSDPDDPLITKKTESFKW